MRGCGSKTVLVDGFAAVQHRIIHRITIVHFRTSERTTVPSCTQAILLKFLALVYLNVSDFAPHVGSFSFFAHLLKTVI